MDFQEKTADLLYKAVKRSAAPLSKVAKGDLIVITEGDSDTIGIVDSLEPVGKDIDVTLQTSSGTLLRRVSDTNFIHVIQKAAMLDLTPHHDYERTDEKLNKEKDMIKELEGHKERPQFSVDQSEKSVLPTSKISLSLRKEIKES